MCGLCFGLVSVSKWAHHYQQGNSTFKHIRASEYVAMTESRLEAMRTVTERDEVMTALKQVILHGCRRSGRGWVLRMSVLVDHDLKDKRIYIYLQFM